jgi:hypothetical protein
MRQQDHGIEAALHGARQFVHAAVVGGGNDVKTLLCQHFVFQLRDPQHFLGKGTDQTVLHLARHARRVLDAGDLPVRIAPITGPGTIASCHGPFDSNCASFQPWRIAFSLVPAALCTTSVESPLNEANTAHVHNSTCGHPQAFAIVRVLLLQRKKS